MFVLVYGLFLQVKGDRPESGFRLLKRLRLSISAPASYLRPSALNTESNKAVKATVIEGLNH